MLKRNLALAAAAVIAACGLAFCVPGTSRGQASPQRIGYECYAVKDSEIFIGPRSIVVVRDGVNYLFPGVIGVSAEWEFYICIDADSKRPAILTLGERA